MSYHSDEPYVPAYHVTRFQDLLDVRELPKVVTNSLDQNKCLVILTDIEVRHSCAHTGVRFEQKTLTCGRRHNPITLGAVVNGVSILLKLRDGEKVRNSLLVKPETT